MARLLSLLRIFLGLFGSLLALSCSDAVNLKNLASPTSLSVPQTPLTIQNESELIGGPSAMGRVGDVMLSNSKIRVVIQKPTKDAGVGSFGGTIIDADHQASGDSQKKEGHDQWGEFFPMVNIEWTVNYYTYSVVKDGKDGGEQILRAAGIIDVYDFLDIDWIADAASAALGQQLTFNDRFDDLRDPFHAQPDLSDLSYEVTTDYILKPDSNYVQVDTTFTNPSDHPISMPVGDFLVGDGELQLLIPGVGFSPSVVSQVGQSTPALIYSAFPGGDVSYGYFYEMGAFVRPDKNELYTTSSVTYSGVTGMLLGEEFLKILPVGSHATPEVHFVIPPNSTKTITRYFVVGDRSAGSVLDTGLKILKVPTGKIKGKVMDQDKKPIDSAIVAIKKLGGPTIVTYTTDPFGNFSGTLPTGRGLTGKAFGSGEYEIWVEKEGYHESGTPLAGSCNPGQVNLTTGGEAEVVCTLGESATVELVGGVMDEETGQKIPSRMTIVGVDPSPETKGNGTFSDIGVFPHPFGIVDAKLINVKGTFGLGNKKSFHLEPGTYHFVFSHGPEYSIYEKEIVLEPKSYILLGHISLKRVVQTPGFISADFHIHALPSPDSAFSVERRALAAVADGLDVLQSSDHDFLTDYGPVVAQLIEKNILSANSVQTVVGDEITPNHYGHLQAFPLVPDMTQPDHGALDWTEHPLDEISPSPDFCMSPRDIIETVLLDPGEEVIQINHISDGPTGLPVAAGWLTTPIYQKKFGVKPFVSYADPVERRLEASPNKPPLPPYGMEDSELIFDNFTSVELTIGVHMHNNELWESSLPTWFNLLNLGLMPTATGDSDSHHEVLTPLGIPRNFVASKVDPRDGMGSYAEIDEEVYANNINSHKVIVSAGPFILMKGTNESGKSVGVGEMIHGKSIQFDIQVEAPEWAWFDTIEIYANTEPIPADDTGVQALVDEAADPAKFAKPYHIPHYIYEPIKKFRLIDETLTDWKNENGKISAHVQVKLDVAEDTWVVAVARGTQETKGYRSLFPIVPDVLKKNEDEPQNFNLSKMEDFHQSEKVGAPAWAFTNPIFIDTDGDADKDGFPFEAKWVREGYSNLRPFKQ